MSDLQRIDEYICINVDKIICGEMRDIVENDCGSHLQEDTIAWAELQAAARVILDNYEVPESG